MKNQRPNPTTCKRRRGTVYVAVLGVTMIVSMIGMFALQVSRMQLKASTDRQAHNEARFLAQSGIEFGLGRIDLDPNWRNNYTSGDLEPTNPINVGNGNFSFKLIDPEDDDLADDTNDMVEVHGIGRVDNAVFVYKATYAAGGVGNGAQGPIEFRSYTNTSGAKKEHIRNNESWGQYFMPNLPSGTVSWRVTSVDLHIGFHDSGIDFEIGLYEPDASNLPSSTQVTNLLVNSGGLQGSQQQWHSFAFAGGYDLSPTQGLCLTLTTNSAAQPVHFDIIDGGITEPNSALLQGNGTTWDTYMPSKILLYRIHGTYVTNTGGTGEFTLVPGSWQQIPN